MAELRKILNGRELLLVRLKLTERREWGKGEWKDGQDGVVLPGVGLYLEDMECGGHWKIF